MIRKNIIFGVRRLIVRGEVFLTKKEFAKINREQEKKGGKPYANPRNVAAGSIRQLDPAVTAGRRLDSFEYDIVTDIGQTYHEEEHLLLKAMGFKTNPNNRAAKNVEEMFAFRDHWAEPKRREEAGLRDRRHGRHRERQRHVRAGGDHRQGAARRDRLQVFAARSDDDRGRH